MGTVSGYLAVPVAEAGFRILAHLHETHGFSIAIVPSDVGVKVTARRGAEGYQVAGRSVTEIAPWLAMVCGCRRR